MTGDDRELEPGAGLSDAEHAAIRELLARAPMVEPRPGALERIIAEVAATPDAATVTSLESRSPRRATNRAEHRRGWVPRVAAAAVVIAIVGVVVGGVGADTRLPAVGDLVERHVAAAGEAMPDEAEPMPMTEAAHMGPKMPEPMHMSEAYLEPDGVVHLVYRDDGGHVVSVFRQEGEADLDDMDGGNVEMMGDAPVWTTWTSQLYVAVVDGEGLVWTVVSDHHDEAMMESMTADLPSHSRSLLDRVVDAADSLLDPWRLGA